ncbi:MAG TPA: thioredoxin domain-containing protein [Kofleriaceae bacterium]
MRRFGCLLIACGLMAGCQTGAKHDTKSSADLEARVKKLEADNAKYAEALAFLQKVFEQQKAQADAQDADEPADDAIFAVDIAPDLAAGQVEGPADAPVTIVEAFDFACPFCRRASDTLEDLMKQYKGKLRIVYKNMVVHPDVAQPAHLASCAAAKQGKYVAFKNDVWTKGFDPYAAAHDPSKLDVTSVIAIAKGIGLDVDKLKTDMYSADCAQRIKTDMDELEKFHVNATPTLFVNGTAVQGVLPEDEFKQLIDQKLETVAKSGVKPADYYQKEIMAKGEKKFRSKKDPKPS